MTDEEYNIFLNLQDIKHINRDEYSYKIIEEILSFNNKQKLR